MTDELAHVPKANMQGTPYSNYGLNCTLPSKSILIIQVSLQTGCKAKQSAATHSVNYKKSQQLSQGKA